MLLSSESCVLASPDKAAGVSLGLVTEVHDAKLCLKRDNV